MTISNTNFKILQERINDGRISFHLTKQPIDFQFINQYISLGAESFRY